MTGGSARRFSPQLRQPVVDAHRCRAATCTRLRTVRNADADKMSPRHDHAGAPEQHRPDPCHPGARYLSAPLMRTASNRTYMQDAAGDTEAPQQTWAGMSTRRSAHSAVASVHALYRSSPAGGTPIDDTHGHDVTDGRTDGRAVTYRCRPAGVKEYAIPAWKDTADHKVRAKATLPLLCNRRTMLGHTT